MGQGDAADGEHGQRDRTANFGEPCRALRCTVGSFRWCSKNGAEKNVVCPALGRCFRRFHGVAGNTDQEIASAHPVICQLPSFVDGQTVFTEMDAAGPLRKRHVKPIVNENARRSFLACRRACYELQSTACERGAVFAGKILFANLNPVHSCGYGLFDFVQEGLKCV